MAVWYIVKSDGSATGDEGRVTSQPTGSFATLGAANYYDNIVAAMAATTPPAANDFIICSASHSHTYGGTAVYAGVSSDNPLLIVSVSDTNMDQESAGATESSGASGDITITGNVAIKSFKATIQDDLLISSSNSHFYAYDSELNFTGAGDRVNVAGDGISVNLFDTDMTWDVDNPSGGAFVVTNAAEIVMRGGSVGATTGNLDALIEDGTTNGGLTGIFNAVDMSNIDGTLLLGSGGAAADDKIKVLINNCDLNAGVAFKNESFLQPNQDMQVNNSSSVGAASEYQFYRSEVAGDVEDQDDSGIHRDESTAFDGGTKVSIKVTTSARCTPGNPLTFELPARFAALSGASTDTLRVYFASTTALTDQNFWLKLYASDGTNKQHYNTYTTRNSDIFATGTAHTDDSGSSTWLNSATPLAGYNEYREDVSTSGDVAADSVPRLFISIAEPSITIYIDSQIDVVA